MPSGCLNCSVGRRIINGNGGPAAIQRIKESRAGDRLLLNKVRYLGEDVSTSVNIFQPTPQELLQRAL